MLMLTHPSLDQVQQAQKRLQAIRRTPLIEWEVPGLPAQVYLKLECLQVSGSFKVRGAGNAMLLAAGKGSSRFWTASAGNMGLGVAWYAKQAGFLSTVIVPDDAPRGKIEAIKDLGAEVVCLPRVLDDPENTSKGGTRRAFYPSLCGYCCHGWKRDPGLGGA